MKFLYPFLVIALLLSACTQNTPTPSAEAPSATESPPSSSGSSETNAGIITIARTTAPDNIDPAQTCTIFGGSLVNNLYDRLVEFKVTGDKAGPEVEPMAAEKWDLSDDGLTYTFYIRKDMTFSSGNPVTSEDVVFSIQRTLTVGGCQGYTLEGGLTGNIKSITAPDDYTVVIQLGDPDPLFLADLTNNIGIIDKKVLEANGGVSEAGTAWITTNAAGSGPFYIISYDPESQIVLGARTDYWKGKPGADKLVFQIVKDPSTLEVLLTSGSIDIALGVPQKDITRISQQGNLKVLSGPSTIYINVGINVTMPPLDDVRIRQALSHATPFEDIIASFGGGFAHPIVGPILHTMPYYTEFPNPYNYDLEKAKQLLAESGLSDVNLSMIVKAGESLQMEIATVIQSSWEKIGVNLEIRTLGSSAFFDELMGLKHQMYMIEDKSANPDPGWTMGYFLRCGDPYNWVGYCNEDVDAWINEARFSLDDERRAELYRMISEQEIKDSPYLQLFNKDHVAVATDKISGFVFFPESEDRYFWLTKGE